MIKKHLLIFLSLLSFTSVTAQPVTRAQFVNNCPDMAFNAIDIYIDGVLTLDNLSFRTASAFINVPATLQFTVAIAPETSTSVADSFFSADYMLQLHDTLIAIGNGLKTVTGYTPFQKFRLDTLINGREMAHDPGNMDIMIVHGSTDSPPVDFRRGVETFVNDINYGMKHSYMALPYGNYTFRITNTTGSKALRTYALPLMSFGPPGQAGIVITSGFMDPSINNNGFPFSTMFVPASGGSFIPLQTTDPEAYARVQYINNSGDAMLDSADIYLGNEKMLNKFAFRTATGFLDAEVNTTLSFGIAPKNSVSVADVFHTEPVAFDSGKTYILVMNGIKSTTGYTPAVPFAMQSFNTAREEGTVSANTDILMIHGSTDFPTIDIREGTNVLADNLGYGNFNPYISASASTNYVYTVTNDQGTSEIAKYKAQLLASGLQGQAITLLLSGFQDPAKNSNRPGYGLYYARAAGGPLVPLAISTSVKDMQAANFNIWPNPVNDKLFITGDKAAEHATVYDITGRSVKQLSGNIKEIPVGELNNGIYFIKLESNDATGNYQFIKQ